MTAGYDDRFTAAPGWQSGTETAAPGHGSTAMPGAERGLPGLHDEERLPWLDAGEDERDEGVDAARVWTFVLAGLTLLILIAAGVWWTAHRRDEASQLANGSIIAAPPGSIKDAPRNPGGKTFDGTGDSSFAVSQGHSPGANLARSGDHADDVGGAATARGPQTGAEGPAVATPDVLSATATVAGAANTVGGIGVQVGAFSTQQAAQGAWEHLAKSYDALSGSAHRIVEGKADIGTVYRLQAVAGSAGAAMALCVRLKAAGLNCQVTN